MTTVAKRFRRLVRHHPLMEQAVNTVRRKSSVAFPEIATEIEVSKEHTLIDCGANVGDITSRFARTGGTVHAFEPGPRAFRVLNRRFRNVPNVECRNEGVFDRECELTFRVPLAHGQWDDLETTVSGSVLDARRAPEIPSEEVKVRCIRLADFIGGLGQRVRVLKIDIEGAEIEVLNDLIETKTIDLVDFVIVETHEMQMPELAVATEALRQRVAKEGLSSKVRLDWI